MEKLEQEASIEAHKENVDRKDSIDDMKGVSKTYAEIMAEHKPNPFGAGHIKLYLMCAVLFLNSTMNGNYMGRRKDTALIGIRI